MAQQWGKAAKYVRGIKELAGLQSSHIGPAGFGRAGSRGRGSQNRGRGRGRGRGGRGGGPTKTKEQLDKELDDYVLKGDPKKAQNKLDQDLDDYFAKRPDEAAADGGQEAAAA